MKTLIIVIFCASLALVSLSSDAFAESARDRAKTNGRIFGQVAYCGVEQERFDRIGQAIVDDFIKLAERSKERHKANEIYLRERKRIAEKVSKGGTKRPDKCDKYLKEFSVLEKRLTRVFLIDEEAEASAAKKAKEKVAKEANALATVLKDVKKQIEIQKKLNEKNEGFGFFSWLILIAVYFVPVIIAKKRNHQHIKFIVLVTVLTGWTVLGWLYALKTALDNKAEKTVSKE
ncbi:MAG: superinfection immunity protein [Alphaproteobacteria bacterium]|nr:superinfection immunity protein [Alphaproteobacteria bacterium]